MYLGDQFRLLGTTFGLSLITIALFAAGLLVWKFWRRK